MSTGPSFGSRLTPQSEQSVTSAEFTIEQASTCTSTTNTAVFMVPAKALAKEKYCAEKLQWRLVAQCDGRARSDR
jgi:hypothetical protein